MPRTATPIVAPTCRRAEIRAEPEPLVSADRALSAAFIVCGMASPRPRPNTANQAAANPVPLPTVVVAPTPRVTAMTVNPTVTRPFTLASGALAVPSAARRGEASRVLPIMPITMPPIMGSSRSPLPMAFTPRTSWKYRGIAKKMPNIANETSVDSVVPQVNPADRNNRSSISGRITPPRSDPPLPARLRPVSQRSQATRTASTATPAAMVPTAMESDQPSWPALMNPYVSAASPPLDRITPTASIRGRSALRDSGSKTATAMTASTTTGTLIRKTEPHQKWSSR